MPEATGPTRPVREGWGVVRPGDRKVHYYVESFSLCNKIGFYLGELEPDGPPSPLDCTPCRRRLDMRTKARTKAAERAKIAEGNK